MGVSQLPHSYRAQMLGRHCSSLHILIKFAESPITRDLHLDSTSLSHSPLSLVRLSWGSLSRASSVRTRIPLSSCLGPSGAPPDSSNVSLTAHILKATSPGIGDPSCALSVAKMGGLVSGGCFTTPMAVVGRFREGLKDLLPLAGEVRRVRQPSGKHIGIGHEAAAAAPFQKQHLIIKGGSVRYVRDFLQTCLRESAL